MNWQGWLERWTRSSGRTCRSGRSGSRSSPTWSPRSPVTARGCSTSAAGRARCRCGCWTGCPARRWSPWTRTRCCSPSGGGPPIGPGCPGSTPTCVTRPGRPACPPAGTTPRSRPPRCTGCRRPGCRASTHRSPKLPRPGGVLVDGDHFGYAAAEPGLAEVAYGPAGRLERADAGAAGRGLDGWWAALAPARSDRRVRRAHPRRAPAGGRARLPWTLRRHARRRRVR